MSRGSLWLRSIALLAVLLVGCAVASASDPVIGFEGLPDRSDVGSYYQASLGVTFTNAYVLTAPGYPGYPAYPPHSGVSLVTNLPVSALTIDFTTPVTSVYGYFSYAYPLTFTAYDASNNVVGTALSQFSSNLNLGNSTGNELIGMTGPGIRKVVVNNSTGMGGYLSMDDLTFSPTSAVPEPTSLLLLASGLGLLLARRRRPRA